MKAAFFEVSAKESLGVNVQFKNFYYKELFQEAGVKFLEREKEKLQQLKEQ